MDLLTYKTCLTRYPTYLYESLTLTNQQPGRFTGVRDQMRMVEQRFNTDLGKRAFKNAAPRLYNKLPPQVKNITTVEVFKKELQPSLRKDWFLSLCIYVFVLLFLYLVL